MCGDNENDDDVFQLYIFRVLRGPFRQEFYQCVTFGAYTARWQEQLYSTVSLLLMYVIPLVTMVTAYLLIFSTIARKSRDFLQRGMLCYLLRQSNNQTRLYGSVSKLILMTSHDSAEHLLGVGEGWDWDRKS